MDSGLPLPPSDELQLSPEAVLVTSHAGPVPQEAVDTLEGGRGGPPSGDPLTRLSWTVRAASEPGALRQNRHSLSHLQVHCKFEGCCTTDHVCEGVTCSVGKLIYFDVLLSFSSVIARMLSLVWSDGLYVVMIRGPMDHISGPMICCLMV